MNRDHLFEKNDYCLYCKDMDSKIPSLFEPCFVMRNQRRPFEEVEIMLLKTEEIMNVDWGKLLLVKNAPKYVIDTMYNSSSKKGGSVNVTTEDGIRLVASFYFDDEEEKSIALENAKSFIDIGSKRRYRFYLGDLEGWGHGMYQDVIISTSASKKDIEDIMKNIPFYFDGYQIFDIIGQKSSDVNMVLSDVEDCLIPKKFMSILKEKITNFEDKRFECDSETGDFCVNEDNAIYLIEKILNHVAEKLLIPSLELGNDNEKPVDIHTHCCYGIF